MCTHTNTDQVTSASYETARLLKRHHEELTKLHFSNFYWLEL
jgi:hypothetical protein